MKGNLISLLKYIILYGGWKYLFIRYCNNWKGNIKIGKNFIVKDHSVVKCYMGGNIVIGNDVSINRFCKIATCGGNIFIGNNVNIGEYMIITAQGG